jgi:hypothetical protein
MTDTYESAITGIDRKSLHVSKRGGGSWNYPIFRMPGATQGLLELLHQRQTDGWEVLAIGFFERGEKGPELKDIML